MTEMLDPAEVAADMLRKQLPGFDTRIIAAKDAIGIRGALPIYAGMSRETVMYPVRSAERNSFQQPGIVRSPLSRDELEHLVMPGVIAIVDQIQKLAIEAVNLQPYIDRMTEAALERGRREGYQEGLEKGRREGRVELLRDLEDARQTLVGLISAEGEDL